MKVCIIERKLLGIREWGVSVNGTIVCWHCSEAGAGNYKQRLLNTIKGVHGRAILRSMT